MKGGSFPGVVSARAPTRRASGVSSAIRNRHVSGGRAARRARKPEDQGPPCSPAPWPRRVVAGRNVPHVRLPDTTHSSSPMPKRNLPQPAANRIPRPDVRPSDCASEACSHWRARFSVERLPETADAARTRRRATHPDRPRPRHWPSMGSAGLCSGLSRVCECEYVDCVDR